jgi:putative FmdB family regulatory protein
MPAYEYECADCSRRFERRQKISEPPIASCPECGGSVKRLISGGAGTISRGSLHSSSDTQPACALGGGCCGENHACCNNMSCEN